MPTRDPFPVRRSNDPRTNREYERERREGREGFANRQEVEAELVRAEELPPAPGTASPKSKDLAYHTMRLSDLIIEEGRRSTESGEKLEPSAETEGEGAEAKTSDYYISDREGRFKQISASKRFLQGLNKTTGIKKDFFQLFTPQEVVARAVERDGDRSLVIAQDPVSMLAVSKPGEPLIKLDEALSVIQGFSPTDVYYNDGELRAHFTPQRAAGDTQIVGEAYSKRFIVIIPVDGLADPTIAPLMIRQICTNGLVAEAPIFVSRVPIGKRDAGYTVERALNAYNGDEYFDRIARRLEVHKNSWASVAEVAQFVRMVQNAKLPLRLASRIVNKVWEEAGQLAHRQFIESQKNAKILRKSATALNRYDLINMVTEARTHLVGREDVRWEFDGFVGTMLARDPDVENSVRSEQRRDSAAFFFNHLASA